MSTLAVDGNSRRTLSPDVDLEVHTITGTHAPFVLPESARAVLVHAPRGNTADAVVDSLLAETSPCATRESQQDSHPSPGSEPFPPPYVDAELPAYPTGPTTEPTTLAMYLFKFGFLFPPLWILGVIIMICPLATPVTTTADCDLEGSKPGPERERFVQDIREVELKWARRCAWALFVLLVLAGVVTTIAFGIYRRS